MQLSLFTLEMASIFIKKATTQREHRSKEKQEFTYASTSMTVTLNNAAHKH